MTFNGLVIVIVSIVVVGAIADGDGCRMLLKDEYRLDYIYELLNNFQTYSLRL